MKVLILGGSKSGKSSFGEDLISSITNKYYIATMIPSNDEDRERIKKHQLLRKDKGFITIEQSLNISSIDIDPSSSLFIDSLTALLLNEMYQFELNNNIKEYKKELFNPLIEKITNDITILFNKYQNVVIISDYIFSNYESLNNKFSDYTEIFLYLLGNIHQNIAELCDDVYLIKGTLIKKIKGDNNE